MVAFGRKQAPVLRLPGVLAPNQSLFLIESEIPNRKGQPVIYEWFAVGFEGQRKTGVLSLHDFLGRTQRRSTRSFPNAGESDIPVAITSLLPEAVAEARTYMSARRQAFEQDLQIRLQKEMSSLAELEGRQLSFLECAYPENDNFIGTRRSKKLELGPHIDHSLRRLQALDGEDIDNQRQSVPSRCRRVFGLSRHAY